MFEHTYHIQMQVQQEKSVRKAPVRFQAPVAILKKKTKRFPSQVKHTEASAAANAIKRQEAIEESEQAASRLFDEGPMATLFDQIATPTRLTIFHSVADTTMQENELIRIGDSISLECNIMECEELVSSPFDLCLIFHPWQWLGGCMDDHNCYSLSMTALRSGRFKRVVRFNARGVGRSLGWKSLGYLSDGQDAYNLILKLLGDSAESADPTHQKTCSLIAYSYGSLVASEALRLLIANQEITNIQARGFISVGFPLGVLSHFFLCSHNSWDSLITSLKQANPTFPFMLVMGDTDQFSSLESTEILVKKAAGSSATIPFKIVEQCDHFFITSAAQKVLREICLEYIQSL